MRINWRRGLAALALIGALAGVATACDSMQSPPAQQQDAQASAQSVEKIIQNQPVASGSYSPARANLNSWVNTWMAGPGKKYYAYLYVGPTPIGYYVLAGPPTSYAVGATSPYHIECPYSGSGGGCTQMPNPGQDATFANQGTGQFQFYGRDATSGRMLEWGGTQMSYFGSDKPLPIPAPPLGDTK